MRQSFLFMAIMCLLFSESALGKKKHRDDDEKRDSSENELHRNQNSGLRPYDKQLSVQFSFLSSDRSTTVGDSDEASTSKSSDMELNFNYLIRFSKVFIGPLIGYSKSSHTSEGSDPIESSTMDIGGMVDYPITDIQNNKMVPHVYGGMRYNTELEQGSKDTASGYRIGLGFGAFYFLGTGIALDPAIELQRQSLSTGGEISSTSTSTIIGLLLGMTMFL